MVEQTQYETVRGIKGIILSIYSPQADGTHTLKNVLLGVPTEDNPDDYRLAVVPERSTPTTHAPSTRTSHLPTQATKLPDTSKPSSPASPTQAHPA